MEVTVYTKDNCGQCDMTKKVLDAAGLDYNIVENADEEPLRTQLYDEGYRSFPVVKPEGEEGWAGFRPDLIKSLALKALENKEVA